LALPDFLLRGIDVAIAERIKMIARDRNWSINDVIIHLLKQALHLTDEDITTSKHQDIAMLGGTWAPDEAAAFRSALEAFESLPEDESPVHATRKAR
jgi:hypothetical protein